MQVRLTKPWLPLDAEQLRRVQGWLGVYEIRAAEGEVVLVGFAGGRSRFGLRGELERELAERGSGWWFRLEVNMQYTTRHRELLMAYVAEHGELPRENRASPPRLGRLSPA